MENQDEKLLKRTSPYGVEGVCTQCRPWTPRSYHHVKNVGLAELTNLSARQ